MDRLDLRELTQVCARRGWTLGTAESCTGGLLAAMVVAEPGVSNFFNGSVVSYSRSAKVDILGVPLPLIQTHGEVSLPVAVAMARGARQALSADWAVSVTGVAGPTGGSADKPVGFVCFAVSGPGFEQAQSRRFLSAAQGDAIRQDIQRQSAVFAFEFLLTAMR